MNTHVTKDVLIVDDDEAVRTVISSALTNAGLSCDTAADGVYALECLEKTRYLVVLLDLVMPRLDGTGVLEKLRALQDGNGEHPIVLVITGSGNREPLHAHSEMVQIVIRKPLDVAHLSELIHDCVEARSLGRGAVSLPDVGRPSRAEH